jgi:hypothetical protein
MRLSIGVPRISQVPAGEDPTAFPNSTASLALLHHAGVTLHT